MTKWWWTLIVGVVLVVAVWGNAQNLAEVVLGLAALVLVGLVGLAGSWVIRRWQARPRPETPQEFYWRTRAEVERQGAKPKG